MIIEVVVFDVGETLMDERGMWNRWADWLGVPREKLREAVRDTIRERQHHRRAFEVVRPGLNVDAASAARKAAGDEPGFRPGDLIADVPDCLRTLRRSGLRFGISGNTSEDTERVLAHAGLAADFIASAGRWKVAKPNPEFFRRVIEAAGVESAAIAYVGDRLDNDVLPAQRAGMTGVFVRRGMWADVQRHWPEAALADCTIDGLATLAKALADIQIVRESRRR